MSDESEREPTIIHFETTVYIERARQDVFGVVSDPSTYPLWNSAVQAVRSLDRGDGTVRRYRMERQLPSGRAENLLEVVSANSPDEVVIRASEGPTPFTYSYRLREVGVGTELAVEADIEVDGVPRLLEPLAGGRIRRGVDENFATLKRLLEAE